MKKTVVSLALVMLGILAVSSQTMAVTVPFETVNATEFRFSGTVVATYESTVALVDATGNYVRFPRTVVVVNAGGRYLPVNCYGNYPFGAPETAEACLALPVGSRWCGNGFLASHEAILEGFGPSSVSETPLVTLGLQEVEACADGVDRGTFSLRAQVVRVSRLKSIFETTGQVIDLFPPTTLVWLELPGWDGLQYLVRCSGAGLASRCASLEESDWVTLAGYIGGYPVPPNLDGLGPLTLEARSVSTD